MKKLTELLPDETIIYRGESEDELFATSVKEFIDSGDVKKCQKIWTAEEEILSFDLEKVIRKICDYGYDGMADEILSEISSLPETKRFVQRVNASFRNHPVYLNDARVFNDLYGGEE